MKSLTPSTHTHTLRVRMKKTNQRLIKRNVKHFLLKIIIFTTAGINLIFIRGEEKSENFQLYKQRVLGQAKNGNLHFACEVYFLKIMLGRISNGS